MIVKPENNVESVAVMSEGKEDCKDGKEEMEESENKRGKVEKIEDGNKEVEETEVKSGEESIEMGESHVEYTSNKGVRTEDCEHENGDIEESENGGEEVEDNEVKSEEENIEIGRSNADSAAIKDVGKDECEAENVRINKDDYERDKLVKTEEAENLEKTEEAEKLVKTEDRRDEEEEKEENMEVEEYNVESTKKGVRKEECEDANKEIVEGEDEREKVEENEGGSVEEEEITEMVKESNVESTDKSARNKENEDANEEMVEGEVEREIVEEDEGGSVREEETTEMGESGVDSATVESVRKGESESENKESEVIEVKSEQENAETEEINVSKDTKLKRERLVLQRVEESTDPEIQVYFMRLKESSATKDTKMKKEMIVLEQIEDNTDPEAQVKETSKVARTTARPCVGKKGVNNADSASPPKRARTRSKGPIDPREIFSPPKESCPTEDMKIKEERVIVQRLEDRTDPDIQVYFSKLKETSKVARTIASPCEKKDAKNADVTPPPKRIHIRSKGPSELQRIFSPPKERNATEDMKMKEGRVAVLRLEDSTDPKVQVYFSKLKETSKVGRTAASSCEEKKDVNNADSASPPKRARTRSKGPIDPREIFSPPKESNAAKDIKIRKERVVLERIEESTDPDIQVYFAKLKKINSTKDMKLKEERIVLERIEDNTNPEVLAYFAKPKDTHKVARTIARPCEEKKDVKNADSASPPKRARTRSKGPIDPREIFSPPKEINATRNTKLGEERVVVQREEDSTDPQVQNYFKQQVDSKAVGGMKLKAGRVVLQRIEDSTDPVIQVYCARLKVGWNSTKLKRRHSSKLKVSRPSTSGRHCGTANLREVEFLRVDTVSHAHPDETEPDMEVYFPGISMEESSSDPLSLPTVGTPYSTLASRHMRAQPTRPNILRGLLQHCRKEFSGVADGGNHRELGGNWTQSSEQYLELQQPNSSIPRRLQNNGLFAAAVPGNSSASVELSPQSSFAPQEPLDRGGNELEDVPFVDLGDDSSTDEEANADFLSFDVAAMYCETGLGECGTTPSLQDSTVPVVELDNDANKNDSREKRKWVCSFCDKVCRSRHELEKHRKVHSSGGVWKCSSCGREFKHLSGFMSHEKTHLEHERKSVVLNAGAEANENDSSENGEHNCNICDTNFRTRYDLERHRMTHCINGMWMCYLCDQSFNDISGLRCHKRVHFKYGKKDHESSVYIPVFENVEPVETISPATSMIAASLQFVAPPVVDVNENNPLVDHRWKCICDQHFRTRRELKIHQKTHFIDGMWRCCFCDMSFTLLCTLAAHRRTHSTYEENSVTSDRGGQELPSNIPVSRILEPVTNIFSAPSISASTPIVEANENDPPVAYKWKCVCDKSFRIRRDFDKHRKAHFIDGKWRCCFCDETFGFFTHLADHSKTHFGHEKKTLALNAAVHDSSSDSSVSENLGPVQDILTEKNSVLQAQESSSDIPASENVEPVGNTSHILGQSSNYQKTLPSESIVESCSNGPSDNTTKKSGKESCGIQEEMQHIKLSPSHHDDDDGDEKNNDGDAVGDSDHTMEGDCDGDWTSEDTSPKESATSGPESQTPNIIGKESCGVQEEMQHIKLSPSHHDDDDGDEKNNDGDAVGDSDHTMEGDCDGDWTSEDTSPKESATSGPESQTPNIIDKKQYSFRKRLQRISVLDHDNGEDGDDSDDDDDDDYAEDSGESEHDGDIFCDDISPRESGKPRTKRSQRNSTHRRTSDKQKSTGGQREKLECFKCKGEITTVEEAMEHVKEHFSLRKANGSVVVVEDGEEGIDMMGSAEDDGYLCSICDKPLGLGANIVEHIPLHWSHKCDDCGRRFTSAKALSAHRRKCYKEDRGCPLCPKEVKDPTQLPEHLLRLLQSICPICSECMGKSKLHLPRHFQDRNFHCEICGNSFVTKYALNGHMATCHGENCYKCKRCNEDLLSKKELAKHRETCDAKKQTSFTCDKCQKTLANSWTYSVHRRTVCADAPGEPIQCDECDKSYPVEELLIRHKKQTHVRVTKSVMCDICGASVKCLKTHMLSHTSERNWVCEECGDSFKKKHHLENHKRKHTGERPYKCEQCGDRFKTTGHLINHRETHKPPEERRRVICKNTPFTYAKKSKE